MLYEARNQPEHPYKNLDIAYGAPNNTDNWTSNSSYYTQPTLQNSGQANSQDNPYIIDSAAKLAYLSYNPSWADEQYFLQTADIDLVEHYWVPINNVSIIDSRNQRAYYYDGGNHTISNLYINTSEQTLTSNNYIGLFGYVYGSLGNHAYIKNVNITSGSVSGVSYVGAIVGYAVYTDITNCSNQDVSVSGGDRYVGGVVGYNTYGSITGSYNTGDVTGSGNSVGGVVGYNNEGSITSSYNTGDVTGTINSNMSYVGGVVGYNRRDEQISLCYNKGNIKSSGERVGGISGYRGTVTTCYNTGSVEGISTVGGIVVGGGTVYNCYYDISKVSSSNSYGTPLTLEQMTVTQNGVAPVDMKYFYSSEWTFTEGETPTLHPYDYGTTEMPTLQDSGQANSQDNPYIIDSEAKLAYLSENSDWAAGKYFLQTENLDFSSYAYFVPINIDGREYTYYYDGGNKTISNLTIQTGRNYVGLFGYVYGSSSNQAYIKNVNITSGSVSGVSYVGAIVGYANYTDITNCSNQGVPVTGNGDRVGGVVGYNYEGSITSSYNTGLVTGSLLVGGVAGYSNGSITSSYNEGDVTSTSTSTIQSSDVGGVVGYHSSGTITSSYNEGAVTGHSNGVGGVVGGNNYGSITSSYNEGAVTGSGNQVGGVAGYNYSGSITSSYNEGVINGNGESVGGVAGYSSRGSITSSYNTGAVTGSGYYVGGVVGYNDSGNITSSYNEGAVTGSRESVGGVVGYSSRGSITSSFNTGDVTGNGDRVGGVAGYSNGSITSSYNEGDVTGDGDYVGGVAGRIFGTISSSYNTGTVSGSFRVGGVAGYVEGSSSRKALISSCFSTGAVTRTSGSSTYFGGVVGYIYNRTNYPSRYVSISWCYYNSDTVGSVVTKAIGYGNSYQCYGLTTAQMQGLQSENYMYLSNSYWNFAPNAYPTLKYVVTTLDIVVETPPTNSGDNPVSP